MFNVTCLSTGSKHITVNDCGATFFSVEIYINRNRMAKTCNIAILKFHRNPSFEVHLVILFLIEYISHLI